MKNPLLVLLLVSFAETLSAQNSNPPNIIEDTDPYGEAATPSCVFIYHNGVLDSVCADFYVKNIGGPGDINVTVTAYEYTENKQFTVQGDARYELRSIFPVNSWQFASVIYSCTVAASFSGSPGITITDGYTGFAALDTTNSTLTFSSDLEWTFQNVAQTASPYLISGFTTPLNSVKAVNQNVAWAAGDSGKVFMTTNGGSNWNSVDGGAIGLDTIYAMEAIDANTAFVAPTSSSDTTFIYRTTDGGTTWQQMFSQSGGFIDGIKMYDVNNGIGLGNPVGGKWTILKTTDGGATWGRIATEPTQLGSEYGLGNSLATSGHANIWFGTNLNRIYHSADTGRTWQSNRLPFTYCSAISFNDSLNGIAGDSSGDIAQTTDGGNSWSSAKHLGTGGVTGISSLGNDLFCIVGNTVYHSRDQGATWAESFINNPPMDSLSSRLTDLSFVANASVISGWTIGDDGSVAAFSGTTTPVGVENNRKSTPTEFALQQNYPNPFNPTTIINYHLPMDDMVTLKVYDVLGREVKTLVSEHQIAGNYSVTFSACNLPSGVYFYSLQAGTYHNTKKLLLLK
jgi:photosystem II stability/assembly factor-like uncharacterized protein